MSATVFLAICILGCDALLYFLFQWTYGEKHRGLARRSNSRPHTNSQKSQSIEFVRASRKATSRQFPVASRFQQIEGNRQVRRIERQAYQRIAATFAEARR
jgi:transposase